MQMTMLCGSGQPTANAEARLHVPAPRTLMARRAAGAIAMLVGWLALAAAPAQAAGRYAAMVVDANTGQILHAEAADEPRYPASLTKMMTLYLVFEQLEAGRLSPQSRIQISAEAASTSPSKLGLPAGQSIAVTDAVKALITKSANDISVAIAEHLAGDEAKFAALMTRKARELGMSATTFRNAHGLPDAGQRTSARDMITLAMRLHDNFPQQVRLFSLRSFAYAGRNHRNHNTLMDNFPGMEGMKTGYTSASGYNLVTSVRRDGRHVLAAVFGGDSAAARNARMRLILTRSLPRASTEKTRKPALVASAPAATRAVEPARVAAAPPPAPIRVTERVPVKRRAPEPMAAASETADSWRSKVRIAVPNGESTTLAALVPSRQALPRGDGQPQTEAARPPSSLQAQASSLGAPPSPSLRTATRADSGFGVSAPGLAAAGGVQIQIGAYPAEAEARQKLDDVRQRMTRLLGSAGIATPAVTVNGRRLFRARFTGLEAGTAAAACSELRRQQIDCLVARAE